MLLFDVIRHEWSGADIRCSKFIFLCMFDCRGVVPFAVYIDRVMPTIIAEIFEKMWSIIKILILHNMHVIEYKNIWNLE